MPGNRNEAVAFGDGTEISHVFVEDRVVYLSNLNIHHVAEVAGRLIHSLALNSDASRFEGLYSQVLHNAFALFASKVVNPKRKARQLPYFRGMLASLDVDQVNAEELEVASSVLLHTQFERGKRTRSFHRLLKLKGAKRRILAQELIYARRKGLLRVLPRKAQPRGYPNPLALPSG